jgi:hypothetical protein
MPFC